ncbi:MAG TPA: YHS domain-containing protein, partial [Polyangiaceae bacterium]|nr:YHS domain-containing protein [Polyangiaceae bacterium]
VSVKRTTSDLVGRSQMTNRVVFVSIVAFALTLSGCQHSEATTLAHSDTAAAIPAAAVKAPGDAVVGDTTTCAVHRDHRIVVTAATPNVKYQGKTYYFCCPVCANKFGERPQDYVR